MTSPKELDLLFGDEEDEEEDREDQVHEEDGSLPIPPTKGASEPLSFPIPSLMDLAARVIRRKPEVLCLRKYRRQAVPDHFTRLVWKEGPQLRSVAPQTMQRIQENLPVSDHLCILFLMAGCLTDVVNVCR